MPDDHTIPSDWAKLLKHIRQQPSVIAGKTIGEAYKEDAIADIAFRTSEYIHHNYDVRRTRLSVHRGKLPARTESS